MAENNEHDVVTDEKRAADAALARKFDAEAAKLTADADARKLESEALAENYRAEARKYAAEALLKETEASDAQIKNRDKLRDERAELSKNKHHHIFHFTSDVGETSVKECITQLDVWRRSAVEGDKKELEVIFTSPGGSIVDGFVLFDYLEMVRKQGWKITTGTLGMAASMAGILLQAGSVRWMGKQSWVLIHQASFMTAGKMGAVEDTVEWIKRVQERIVDIFASRAAMADTRKGNDSEKQIRATIKKNWERKDWWLSSDQCLEFGFVDQVL